MKLSRWRRREPQEKKKMKRGRRRGSPPLMCTRRASARLGGYTNIFVARRVQGEPVLRFTAELQLLLNHFVNPSSKNPTEDERRSSPSCGSNTKDLLFFLFFFPSLTHKARSRECDFLENNVYINLNGQSFFTGATSSLLTRVSPPLYTANQPKP